MWVSSEGSSTSVLWNSESQHLSCLDEEEGCHGQHLGPQKEEDEEFQGAELSLRVGQGSWLEWKSRTVFRLGSEVSRTWVQMPLLPLTSCVTLSKSLHLSERWSPHP